MDDFWSFWKSPHRSRYGDRLLPTNQVHFLQLLDQLGIPHKPEKQQFGHKLTIIGFEVDPNAMTITLAEEKKRELVERIQAFVEEERDPESGKRRDRRPTLREWQQMLGELNWALNVLPLARVGMNSSYHRIRPPQKVDAHGKPILLKPRGPHTRIYHNRSTVHDLLWFARRLKQSRGVHLIRSHLWPPQSAQRRIFVDACLEGLGVFIERRHNLERPVALYCPLDGDPVYRDIFHNEMLAILCALLYCANHPEPNLSRILIYSDSFDSVHAFNTLGTTSPLVMPILMASADVIMDNNVNPRVLHIPGSSNVEADWLSRNFFIPVFHKWPLVRLFKIQPPRDALGERRL